MSAGMFTPSRGRVLVFGAGYVGLATAAAALLAGWSVTVLDISAERVEIHRADLTAGRDPLGEPGMCDALTRGPYGAGGVVFASYAEDSPGLPELVKGAVVVCAVGTPLAGATTDASAVIAVAKLAAAHGAEVFVLRSTVAPEVIRGVRFVLGGVTLVVMPEFLREGHAVADSLHPARIVVGADSPKGEGFGATFLVQPGLSHYGHPPVQTLLPEEASLAKLALNTALSLRVWLAGAVGSACESIPGANADRVLHAVYLDQRLGTHASQGLGAAGPCLPKDSAAFGHVTGEKALTTVLRRSHELVAWRLVDRIRIALGRHLGTGRPSVAVIGIGFKPDSADWRGSPALTVIRLLGQWSDVTVRDDRVPEHELALLREELGPDVRFERAVSPATILVVLASSAILPAENSDARRWAMAEYQGNRKDGGYGAPPRIVADPFRVTSPFVWPRSMYLGGGLGPAR